MTVSRARFKARSSHGPPHDGPHLVIILRPDVVDVPEVLTDPVRGLVVPHLASLFTLRKKAKNRALITGRTVHRVSAPPTHRRLGGLGVDNSWRRPEACGGSSEAWRWSAVALLLKGEAAVAGGSGSTGVRLGRSLLHRWGSRAPWCGQDGSLARPLGALPGQRGVLLDQGLGYRDWVKVS